MVVSTVPTPSNAQSREKIYEVATHLFAEKGYRGTSMRDVGLALGLHAGSLYAHIRSKEDILFEIIERIIEIHEQDMGRIMATTVPPTEKLREFIRCHVGLIAGNLEAATVYFHEWRHLDAKRRKLIVKKRDRFEKAVRQVISQGIEEGTFATTDADLATKATLGAVNWIYEWYSPTGRLGPEELSERFATHILDGLRVRSDDDLSRGRTPS
jgi:AcrR family transcriptional regulator